MNAIAVIVPVLARPQNVAPLAESLWASTERASLTFVCTPNDEEEIRAVDETGADYLVVEFPPGPGDYARKIQAGYESVGEEGAPLVLLAADDLIFHPGWLETVEAVADRYDVGVIGTNDLANPSVLRGAHSTHPVVRRCYIDRRGGVAGSPGTVYSDAYTHNYVDNELVATAIARGCYHHAFDAILEHRHPLWRTAPDDETYRLGQQHAARDARLFESRRHLWERERVEA